MWIRRATNLHQLLKVVHVPSSYLKALNSPTPIMVCLSCRNLSTSIFHREKSGYVYDPKTNAYVPNGQKTNNNSRGRWKMDNLSTSIFHREKSGYVYDPKTDAYVPNGQKTNNNSRGRWKMEEEEGDDSGKNNSARSFLKQWARNLFMLTGGIVWVGVIWMALFVDIKESTELVSTLQDGEEGVRLFAFYDIARTKSDLANIISDEEIENAGEIVVDAGKKELALKDVLNQIKSHHVVTETLGFPIHFVGFRAAAKLDSLAKNFQDLTQPGVEKCASHKSTDQVWTAECLLEGPNGLVTLLLTFEKPFEQQNWVLLKVEVESLEKSGNTVLHLESTLPEGVSFES